MKKGKPKKPKAVFDKVEKGILMGDCTLHGRTQMIILRYKDKEGKYYACRKCEESK